MANPGPSTTVTSLQSVTPASSGGYTVGQSITDPISFYGVTPIAQRAGSAQAAVATTAPTNSSPYGYTTSAQADAIVALVNELRATLVALGLMKGAA